MRTQVPRALTSASGPGRLPLHSFFKIQLSSGGILDVEINVSFCVHKTFQNRNLLQMVSAATLFFCVFLNLRILPSVHLLTQSLIPEVQGTHICFLFTLWEIRFRFFFSI